MDSDVALRLKKRTGFTIKLEVLVFLYKLLKKLRKHYYKFAWLLGKHMTFNHSAPNCIKSLLTTFSMSPKVTSK